MFIKISPIRRGGNVKGLSNQIAYLEKENQGRLQDEKEHFFNQHAAGISAKTVQEDLGSIKIDSRLKKRPFFYNVIISLTKRELHHIKNQTDQIKRFTREVMKHYAEAFGRKLNGRPLNENDIKYYAKIEHNRYYTTKDPQVRENQPHLSRIQYLEKEIREKEQTPLKQELEKLKKELQETKEITPNKLGDQVIRPGLQKQGYHSHVHIIVSRRDVSNSIGISPGKSQKPHTQIWNGKIGIKGFNQEQLKHRAEESFDKLFNYPRNYVESYTGQKARKFEPETYYRNIQRLPHFERKKAFEIINERALSLTPQLSQQALKQFQKVVKNYERSAGIEY